MSATARMMAFLGLDPKDFNKGVDSAHTKVGGFGKALEGMKGKLAAAFTVGAALKIGKDALAMGDMIGELAGNLVMTTEEVQSLSFLFKTTGSSAETFERAVNRVNGAIGDVNNLVPGAREKLEKMGVTLEMIDAGPAKVLERMGQYLVENSNSAAATADVYDILGDRVKNMTNGLVQLGQKGLAEVIRTAAEAGKVLDAQELEGLGKTQDAIDSVIEYAKKRAAALVAGGINIFSKPDPAKEKKKVDDAEKAAGSGAESRKRAEEKKAAEISKDADAIRAKTAFDALSDTEKRLALEQQLFEINKQIDDGKQKVKGPGFDTTRLSELTREKAMLEADAKEQFGNTDARVQIYAQVIELEKQITAEKQKQAAFVQAEKTKLNAVELAQLDKNKAEIEARIAGIKNPAMVGPVTDQFTRIGGGVGPVGGAAMDLSTPKKTLTVIQKMQIDMAKLVDYAAKQKSGVF